MYVCIVSMLFDTLLIFKFCRVALENCIVCDGAIIESNSQLKNCLIGSNHIVPEKSEHTNEVLTKTDRLMEF